MISDIFYAIVTMYREESCTCVYLRCDLSVPCGGHLL